MQIKVMTRKKLLVNHLEIKALSTNSGGQYEYAK